MPSKAAILEFVQSSPQKVGKREIARAFGVKGSDRVALKQVLREMADEGLISSARKRIRKPGGLPSVTVIEVAGQDEDGDSYALPIHWETDQGEPPRILLRMEKRTGGPDRVPGVGDRILARIDELPKPDPAGYRFQARPIKRLPRGPARLIGIFRARSGRQKGGVIDPVDRKQLREWVVEGKDSSEAESGELVEFEPLRRNRYGPPQARIIKAIGQSRKPAPSQFDRHRPSRHPQCLPRCRAGGGEGVAGAHDLGSRRFDGCSTHYH